MRQYGRHVRFVWVKAHIGIVGNELADEAAKLAAQQRRAMVYTKFPISYAKHKIREELTERWEQEYQQAQQGEWTKKLLPSLDAIRRWRKVVTSSFETTQVITGHGFNLQYLHRFKIKSSNMCPCGLGEQTWDHIVMDCPRFEGTTRKLTSLCNEARCGIFELRTIAGKHDVVTEWIAAMESIVHRLKDFNTSVSEMQ